MVTRGVLLILIKLLCVHLSAADGFDFARLRDTARVRVVEMTAPTRAVDLRARLKRQDQPITETWVYTWQP